MLSGYMAKSEEGIKNNNIAMVTSSNAGQKTITDSIQKAQECYNEFLYNHGIDIN